jgi:hypothetical protein
MFLIKGSFSHGSLILKFWLLGYTACKSFVLFWVLSLGNSKGDDTFYWTLQRFRKRKLPVICSFQNEMDSGTDYLHNLPKAQRVRKKVLEKFNKRKCYFFRSFFLKTEKHFKDQKIWVFSSSLCSSFLQPFPKAESHFLFTMSSH